LELADHPLSYAALFRPTLDLFYTVTLDFQLVMIDNLKSTTVPAKTDCSYSLLGSAPRLVHNATGWKPIGRVGQVSVPESYFIDAVDVSKSVKLRKGYQSFPILIVVLVITIK